MIFLRFMNCQEVVMLFHYNLTELLEAKFTRHNPLRRVFCFTYSGLQSTGQPEQLAPAAPAEKTDGAQYQTSQF